MRVVSNQFSMAVTEILKVWYYDIKVDPEIIKDSFLLHQIYRQCKVQLTSTFGLYVISGNNLFTSHDLEESIALTVNYKEIEYSVYIDHGSKTQLKNSELYTMKSEENPMVLLLSI